jgi:formamidopyrimidine-DNA glycosylase
MPELPEVETIARGVDRRLRGDSIVSAWFSSYREPFKTPPDEMMTTLPGLRIAHVRRVGKHIVADLEESARSRAGEKKAARATRGKSERDRNRNQTSERQLLVHLGMTGRLLVSAPEVPLPPHTHAVLGLASGRELRFVDPRRFGRIGLVTGFTGPGSEPLTISKDDFAALFRGRKLSIKAALLNQSLLHGVGNIYADESLFRAGIRPTRAAGRLTREELGRLHKALRLVLLQAIRAGGSSVSDYVDADGERGFFQIRHRVYQRTGEPCLVCGTPIRRIVLAGRSTHFCPVCQR